MPFSKFWKCRRSRWEFSPRTWRLLAQSRQDLLNGLIQKAAKVGRVEKLKRDSIVYAFDNEGYDPSQLPGVDGLEEPPGGFGAAIPGGEVIMWDRKNGAQEFGTWLNQLVRAKFAVWWDKKRWSLRATDGKGVRREYWISGRQRVEHLLLKRPKQPKTCNP